MLWLPVAATFVAAALADLATTERKLDELTASVKEILSQQVTFQLGIGDFNRQSYSSGILNVRNGWAGTSSYDAAHGTSHGFMAAHDHSNNIRTVGLGEFSAILNGVPFRTRHNDYRLFMRVDPNVPGKQAKRVWNKRAPIPFPDVPPSVLAVDQTNISLACDIMRKYFRAWLSDGSKAALQSEPKDVDVSDWASYFQANLVVMEGYFQPKMSLIDSADSFSDRHYIDAQSYEDLRDRITYTSLAGTKDPQENLAFLPSQVLEYTTTDLGVPVPRVGQFSYNIFAQPLSRHLPLSQIYPRDDLATRMRAGGGRRNPLTMAQHTAERGARFTLNGANASRQVTGRRTSLMLDELMYEVPGPDGPDVVLPWKEFGEAADAEPALGGKELNAARYHRSLRLKRADAMGTARVQRAEHDQHVFMAMTTFHDKVVNLQRNFTSGKNSMAVDVAMTYAIPLEVVYTTPLSSWNPYGLKMMGTAELKKEEKAGKGEKIGKVETAPLPGVSEVVYYLTPLEFFSDLRSTSDPADTAASFLWIKGKDGKAHRTVASGTWIQLPPIANVPSQTNSAGKPVGPRLRFPIAPDAEEGLGVRKMVDALTDTLLDLDAHTAMLREANDTILAAANWSAISAAAAAAQGETATLEMRSSLPGEIAPHTHLVELTAEQTAQLAEGSDVQVTTSQDNGHTHTLTIRKDRTTGKVSYSRCDMEVGLCFDSHPFDLKITEGAIGDVNATAELGGGQGSVHTSFIPVAPPVAEVAADDASGLREQVAALEDDIVSLRQLLYLAVAVNGVLVLCLIACVALSMYRSVTTQSRRPVASAKASPRKRVHLDTTVPGVTVGVSSADL